MTVDETHHKSQTYCWKATPNMALITVYYDTLHRFKPSISGSKVPNTRTVRLTSAKQTVTPPQLYLSCTDLWVLWRSSGRLGDCPGLDRCSLYVEASSSWPNNQPTLTCAANKSRGAERRKKENSKVSIWTHVTDDNTHTISNHRALNFLVLSFPECSCQL